MKKNISLFLVFIILLTTLFTHENTVYAKYKFSKYQQKNADRLYKVCVDNYEKYGILPSVCIAQAMQETRLGKDYNNGNLWGVNSGRTSYPSIEKGCIEGYFKKTLHNGLYDDALFLKDWRKQIYHILYDKNGNAVYCQPAGNYYNDICSIVINYNLTKYDKKMFKEIKQRKIKAKKKRIRLKKLKKQKKLRKGNLKKVFTVVYDESVPLHLAYTNHDVGKKGTVQIWDTNEYEMYGIFDLGTDKINNKNNEYIIYVGIAKLHGCKVKLHVNENAKG